MRSSSPLGMLVDDAVVIVEAMYYRSPLEVNRTLQLLVDGQVAAELRDQGEKVEVRVRATPRAQQDIGHLLDFRLPLPGGGSVPLGELVVQERQEGLGNLRHYNFRRTITVEADIDRAQLDTVTANRRLLDPWQAQISRFPDIDLDFSGELDDDDRRAVLAGGQSGWPLAGLGTGSDRPRLGHRLLDGPDPPPHPPPLPPRHGPKPARPRGGRRRLLKPLLSHGKPAAKKLAGLQYGL